MTSNEIDLGTLREKLKPFIEINTTSSICIENERVVIANPWEDDTIDIEVQLNDDHLVIALNNILFPPQFSAIYHIDTCTFEFIYTVTSPDNLMFIRKFDFIFKGLSYPCWYSVSSDRLLSIAAAIHLKTPTSYSDHRNLKIYKDFCHQNRLPKSLVQFFNGKKPISFFVGPIKPGNSDEILEIARHINFYMYYFDRESPLIVIHKPNEEIWVDKAVIQKHFPEKILASQIDTFMLDLWSGACRGSGRLAYIYYYQMLEYAAFYFVEEQVKLRIEKILKRPDILSSTDSCLSQVIDEVVEYRQSDEVKLTAVIRRAVSSDKVWGVIEQYRDYFTKPQDFDGGYKIEPFIKDDWTAEDFERDWIPKVPDRLRQIRNALVHSRESRVGQVISPTKLNNKKLLPWVKLIEEISCQIAIYRNL
jgi:hypothetical protein